MTKKVWCALYIGQDPEPRTIGVNVAAVRDVDDLRKAILAEAPILLAQFDAVSLKVYYPAGTPIRGVLMMNETTTALDPRVEISSLNLAGDDTLIVVAPPPVRVKTLFEQIFHNGQQNPY
jgi:hypothetical protein